MQQVSLGILAFTAFLASDIDAFAQQPPQGFQIGVAGVVSTAPFVGEVVEGTPIPFIAFRGDGFSLGVNGAELDLFERGPLSGAAVLRPRFSELDDPNAPELATIDRSITGDVGLSASYSFGRRTSANVEFLQEFTGEHGGQEVSFGLSYIFSFEPVFLTASVGGVWQSGALTEYLYGVLPEEATPELAAFAPGAAVSPQASLQAGYNLTDRIGLFGRATATILPDAIEESPIVSDGATFSLLTGVTYSF